MVFCKVRDSKDPWKAPPPPFPGQVPGQDQVDMQAGSPLGNLRQKRDKQQAITARSPCPAARKHHLLGAGRRPSLPSRGRDGQRSGDGPLWCERASNHPWDWGRNGHRDETKGAGAEWCSLAKQARQPEPGPTPKATCIGWTSSDPREHDRMLRF
ncbi:uncharacterized protein B0I36DRAFT_126913 [Microdochium trichocladiopsis]|uniref:Uncharacterized protein n=1 Tax=Microdochium trichocladiopsis TaxID=1682393 RepID=A0A9P8Y1U3_9PEZI|nr:uncharacterized protein B0I36DRAFT_126913 [Microdochium trichocladiopsis]KAH7028889.1 hypothetical protein B0I36DRAFT_126913 [Microdochium trichocladiopsis]